MTIYLNSFNSSQKPVNQGEVKNEKNLSQHPEDRHGDSMPRELDFGELGRVIVSLFAVFYGFFALTNPSQYPILERVASGTQYWNLAKLDPIIGIIMMALGVYFLFLQED